MHPPIYKEAPMADKVQKPCRICGKMFTPCADCESVKSMFRWRRVACSPECAREYFAKIEKSRRPEAENLAPRPIRPEAATEEQNESYKQPFGMLYQNKP